MDRFTADAISRSHSFLERKAFEDRLVGESFKRSLPTAPIYPIFPQRIELPLNPITISTVNLRTDNPAELKELFSSFKPRETSESDITLNHSDSYPLDRKSVTVAEYDALLAEEARGSPLAGMFSHDMGLRFRLNQKYRIKTP